MIKNVLFCHESGGMGSNGMNFLLYVWRRIFYGFLEHF